MKNQYFAGTPTMARFAKCPSTVKSGDAVLVGSEPAVALDDYQANELGTTFYFGGSFNLTVVGATVLSPASNAALGPGHKVYYDGGTLDSATNVTTGGTLDGASGSPLFGFIDPSYVSGVSSGVTDTAAIVRLQGAE